MRPIFFLSVVLLLCAVGNLSCQRDDQVKNQCLPTPYGEIGPMYRPNAPLRDTVGKGYVLFGRVLSAEDCQPLVGSRIELWLVGPSGQYGDEYRATIITGKTGAYRFECDPPPAYVGRPPHIHIMVTADNHERLITQHYPTSGVVKTQFDLVLESGK